MNRPQMLIIAASLAIAGTAFAAPAESGIVLDASNPFAKPSALPFNYPAFDKIKDEHFLPAYAAGMREQLREVAGIANNSKAPTFENTAETRASIWPERSIATMVLSNVGAFGLLAIPATSRSCSRMPAA